MNGKMTLVRLSRWLMVAALLCVLALGACTSGDGGDASPKTDATPGASMALAGELGPGGGVLWDGREMQSQPDELFVYQEDSAPTVVFAGPSTSDPNFHLGAVRSQQSICVSLSAAGKQDPTSQLCDVPAYRALDEVVDHSFVAQGNIPLEGTPTRVVYGVTYLDVASVSLDDDETASIEVQKALPFWMQRFFVMAVPEDAAGPLRLLDAEGIELARLPLPSAQQRTPDNGGAEKPVVGAARFARALDPGAPAAARDCRSGRHRSPAPNVATGIRESRPDQAHLLGMRDLGVRGRTFQS